jgi:hypothetical protein
MAAKGKKVITKEELKKTPLTKAQDHRVLHNAPGGKTKEVVVYDRPLQPARNKQTTQGGYIKPNVRKAYRNG